MQSSWTITAQVRWYVVKEDSGAFAVTTGSLTMEIMAVTKAMVWLESQTHECFLSDSVTIGWSH
uniref:Uncharacterized protein n=1 Tax=Arion vulgaris TaxID=1028688 RepID=A0A0B7ASC7_9EUPU